MNPNRVLNCCCLRLSGLSIIFTIGIVTACAHSMAAYIYLQYFIWRVCEIVAPLRMILGPHDFLGTLLSTQGRQ